MTQVYIVRHAEAEGNIYRVMHGRYNSLLTPNGRRQLPALAARFAGIPLDAVYSSPLYRAMETARAVAAPKGLSPIPDSRFLETDMGPWDGLPFGELEHRWPEQMRRFNQSPEQWHIPGGETFAQYTGRFWAGILDLAARHEGGTIAVFTHGYVSAGSFRRQFGAQMHNAARCDNTGVSLLRCTDGTPELIWCYDNSHLSPEISTLARQRWWRQTGKKFNLRYRDLTDSDAAWTDPAFCPDPAHRVRVALLGDDAVGWVSFAGGTLTGIWLRPEHRHIRLGDQLLGQAVLEGRENGLRQLTTGVPTANVEALCFFSRHGFAPVQMDDAYTVLEAPIAPPA